jgi:hypothetical protein
MRRFSFTRVEQVRGGQLPRRLCTIWAMLLVINGAGRPRLERIWTLIEYEQSQTGVGSPACTFRRHTRSYSIGLMTQGSRTSWQLQASCVRNAAEHESRTLIRHVRIGGTNGEALRMIVRCTDTHFTSKRRWIRILRFMVSQVRVVGHG